MSTPKRRTLRFNSLDEALIDAQRLAGGPIKVNGNWTPGQVIGHVARAINGSIDGVAFRAPLRIRIVGKLLRNRLLNKGLPSGVKFPEKVKTRVVPEPDFPVEEAVRQLAQAIERTRKETMNQRHPVFGWLSHEQWMLFHCRHAENHFSYIEPGER